MTDQKSRMLTKLRAVTSTRNETSLNPKTTGLLLDISSSMNRKVTGHNETRLSLLKKEVGKLDWSSRVWSFANGTKEIKTKEISEIRAWGLTFMAPAIREASKAGMTHGIMVTDGGATDRSATLLALQETGLILEVIFISEKNEAVPDILTEISQGGQVHREYMKAQNQLANKIKGLLGASNPSSIQL